VHRVADCQGAIRRRRWTYGIAAIAFVVLSAALPCAADNSGETFRGALLEREQAVADIRYALIRAEAVHPRLYWYTSRDAVQRRADELIAALPKTVHAMDVYLVLAELTGMLGDGHMAVSRPRAADGKGDVLSSYTQRGGTRFVADVKEDGASLKVLWAGPGMDGLVAGDLIRSINGQDALSLHAKALALLPGEPELKRYLARRLLGDLLWDIGVDGPFFMEGVFQGRPGHIQSLGYPAPPREIAEPERKEDSNISYHLLPRRLGLIDFKSMHGDLNVFDGRLKVIFEQIGHDRPVGLVVDLRDNLGGNSLFGTDLLAFITNRPSRPFAQKGIRASPEARKCLAGYDEGKALEKVSDSRGVFWDVPLQTPPPNPLRFAGPVAFLIGPGTFSSANILANTAGDFGLAILVGRPTAERPNNYGEACEVSLPHSGITLSVPSAWFVRANGDRENQDDVLPDILVARGTGISEEDPDLAAARAWIERRVRATSHGNHMISR
jgi:hypothetical protein